MLLYDYIKFWTTFIQNRYCPLRFLSVSEFHGESATNFKLMKLNIRK